MKEFKYVIKDEQGIHARPAGLFVKEAAAFPCKVTIEKDGKEADAKRIFAAATFGLFTNGLDKFDEAYESGLIDGVLTTNLIYQTPELLSRPYYINCDMSKYVALMIDTLNHDGSISDILDPSERIQVCVEEYKKAHGQL